MSGTTTKPAPAVTLDQAEAALSTVALHEAAATATRTATAQSVAGLTGEDFRSFASKYTSGPLKGELKPEAQRNKGFYTTLTLKRGEAVALGYPAELLPPYSKVKVAVTVTIVAPDPDDA